jgi:DNA-binding NtrC family response regulator
MKGGIQHICLAEDDPDDYLFFSDILKEINSAIKLTWFQTCEDLLEFLSTGSDLPCLIVLDMNMPKMDGQTCLMSIKKELELNHIPVIILSTAGRPSTINMAYQAGAYKYYHKPSSIDDLRKVISEILATPITRFDLREK